MNITANFAQSPTICSAICQTMKYMSTFFQPSLRLGEVKVSKAASIKGWFIVKIWAVIKTIKNWWGTETAPKSGAQAMTTGLLSRIRKARSSVWLSVSPCVFLSLGHDKLLFLFHCSHSFPNFIAFFLIFFSYFLSDLLYRVFGFFFPSSKGNNYV